VLAVLCCAVLLGACAQIMAGLVLSLLANLVSLVANVVVHITANEKMRFVCYRYTTTPPLLSWTCCLSCAT
jgi:hypothetical protein